MSDASNYSDLVREAFIDPIRSVMIIDDQYPTWEELLDEDRWNKDKHGNLATPIESKTWWSDPAGPRDVLKQFRSHDKGLMIDIHDGRPPKSPPPERIGSYLHQSDLLVLDYHLEGEAAGGERAQELTQHLLNENHFNLIVVHTNTNDLFGPFSEILLRLLSKCASEDDWSDRADSGQDAIDDCEDDALAENLKSAFGVSHYLALRHPTKGKSKALGLLMKGSSPFDEINPLLINAGINRSKFRDIMIWLMRNFERRSTYAFADDDSNGINWSSKDDLLWIRTDRGFISFARKKETADLISCLQKALEDWQPTPSRLLSAKFRTAIDEFGTVAEDKMLSKRHVYAKFYDDLKSADNDALGALLDEHVVRQTERLTAEIQKEVREFGMAIRSADELAEGMLDFSKHYGVNLANPEETKKAVRHYNNYVSCIPVHGYHLTSGHIFELEGEKWAVVSPACDMVPGQRRMGFSESLDNHRPFVAIKLYENGKDLKASQINSGSYVFLEEDEEIEVYCTFQKPSEPLEQAPKVTWSNFIALNQGILSKDTSLDIVVINPSPNSVRGKKHNVQVIAQLRYEFALNLTNRLGATMTRVGLSFSGPQES